MPLFKKAIYEDSVYPKNNLKELSRPVIAFHSYKGGVGRTLSLIAFAQAWTSIQDDPQKNKLLIIDSDLEAPGLTLIQGNLNETAFSYLDLLTLIQDNNSIEEIVSTAEALMGTLTCLSKPVSNGWSISSFLPIAMNSNYLIYTQAHRLLP